MLYLQSVNRWLRFTGFRLAVCYEATGIETGPIGFRLRWFGWRNFGGWDCRAWQLVSAPGETFRRWERRE
jgi:hypothetical protein